MWNPFRNKVVYSIPNVNSVWRSREPNPFERHEVRVLVVREGHVKYNIGKEVTPYTVERSASLEIFHKYYLQGGD